MEQFCSDHANLRTGKLRIASNGERTNAILIPGVSAFAKQYPGIYIELTLEHHLEEISKSPAIRYGRSRGTFSILVEKRIKCLSVV